MLKMEYYFMFYAKKSLGQNFLINQGILEKIVSAAELEKEDTILEVGPGTGNLTKLLSERTSRVIAVEKDCRLIEELKGKFKDTNIEIVEGDILKLDVTSYMLHDSNYKVIGNIPYYITSNFLRTVFEEWPMPKLIVLTVQKEVAQRIIAKPPKMNLLALSVQLYSDPKIVGYVSRGSFRPMPKVDSVIIRLTPKEEVNTKNNDKTLTIAKKAFAGKRKQLQNTLPEINFESLGIDPKSRPEELSVSDWLKI